MAENTRNFTFFLAGLVAVLAGLMLLPGALMINEHDAVMSATSAPTVVIADDDQRVRDALGALIVAHPGMDLAGSVESGFDAAALCERVRPTIAVVDVMMPGGGREAILASREVSPATSIMVYTARSDRRTRERMLEAGAVAVVVKGGGRDITSEIELVVARGTVVPRETAAIDE